MNENTNQITEEQLEQVAQQIKPENQMQEPENIPVVTKTKSGSGLFIILLLLVLVAGLVFFVAQMMVKASNTTTDNSEQPMQQVTNDTVVKEKTPAEMTEDELYNDLEKDVDQSMSDLDKDIDSIESELNQLTVE